MTNIKVTRLPIDPGPAAWNSILPEAPAPKPLEESITADWLVIGGGYTGLAAVRRLSQLCSGDKIVLLDACRIAEGPAGRNSGFMIDLPHDLASEDYGGALISHLDITESKHLDVKFEQLLESPFDAMMMVDERGKGSAAIIVILDQNGPLPRCRCRFDLVDMVQTAFHR